MNPLIPVNTNYTVCGKDFYLNIRWQLKFIVAILRSWDALRDFLDCQRFGNIQQTLLSFVEFSFDFDKADTLLSSVIKTYQSESG